MSLRQYLFLMSLGAVICWGAWLSVLNNLDPAQAGITGFIFFYSTLFLALTGTFSVLGFIVRKISVRKDLIVFQYVRDTFRQGLTTAAIIIIFIVLQQFRLLTWWNLLILLIIIIAVEGVILTNRGKHKQEY